MSHFTLRLITNNWMQLWGVLTKGLLNKVVVQLGEGNRFDSDGECQPVESAVEREQLYSSV